MTILIVGAGQVGMSVMEALSDDHEISMIDRNASSLDHIPFEVNVSAGNGLEEEVLKSAGIEEAEIVIATTSEDHTNVLIGSMAKLLTDCFTIARVSDPSFANIWDTREGAFGIDAMIDRSKLTARQITELLWFQSTRQESINEEMYCHGKVKMSEFKLESGSDLIGKKIKQTNKYSELNIVGIFRNSDFMLVPKDTSFEEGDRITVFGSPQKVDDFGISIASTEMEPVQDTFDILGGGDIGYQTALLLENTPLSIRIFEEDPDRAQFLSEHLSQAMVLQADITERTVWEEENIPESDMLLVSTGDDATNVLATLIGKDYESPRVVSVGHEHQYLSLFESLDVTRVVHPREVVASSIINYIQDSYIGNVTELEHESGAVFEIKIDAESQALDNTVEELEKSFDQPLVVGAMVRQNHSIIPTPDTSIKLGDQLVILTTGKAEDIVEKL
ncbi:Trk system potassium transporter TrkA [Aliifodinibius salipaludis]|uniref:Trk system potassium uptake protein TrkA n=1 Tax=Fodinibius salipaludis TaxID=2032627 RepID=A0A2A2GEL5_9BACT|nr:Trk system potassium transporter TrkA [Aliifodinibius salipaludis]PAU95357.1 Trk system potassium transporter TrkA [Aliifodinibius salipaludis]